MSQLDIYRTALLAVDPDVSSDRLCDALDRAERGFAGFIVDHGLGPLWHERTGRPEFHQSRMQAEALFAMQEDALVGIGDVLDRAGVEHVVIKGAANRQLIYNNPAIRASSDMDILVRANDRVTAGRALLNSGFSAVPKAHNISIELLLNRNGVNVDLHWRLLRDGRLRNEDIDGMLLRRRKLRGRWMLNPDDAFFLLLVHPAFTKYLAGWQMGLHRVADIVIWLQTQSFDWNVVLARLEENGVRTSAWATLRWIDLLSHPHAPPIVDGILKDLEPGPMRRLWLESWLRHNLPERTAGIHKLRLLAFSLALHDNVKGVFRALSGRYQAHRRRQIDLAVFQNLLSE